jgi:hypothetical protein
VPLCSGNARQLTEGNGWKVARLRRVDRLRLRLRRGDRLRLRLRRR